MEIVKKGKVTYYIYDNYIYVYKNRINTRFILSCIRSRTKSFKKCSVILNWKPSTGLIKLSKYHNHDKPDDRIPEIRLKSQLVELVMESDESPSQIVCAKVSESFPKGADIASRRNLKRSIARYKRHGHIPQEMLTTQAIMKEMASKDETIKKLATKCYETLSKHIKLLNETDDITDFRALKSKIESGLKMFKRFKDYEGFLHFMNSNNLNKFKEVSGSPSYSDVSKSAQLEDTTCKNLMEIDNTCKRIPTEHVVFESKQSS